MSCLKIKDIYAYLENELPPESQPKVEEHLKSCPVCRRLLEDRRAYLESISNLPDLELPPDFTDKVIAKLPELRSPSRVWLALAGGIYVVFSLLVVILIAGIKSSLFPVCLEIFKYLFSLATNLSHFAFDIFQLVVGLFKALKIFLEVAGRFLADIFPVSGPTVISLILGIILTLTVFWALIKPTKISHRSENHENKSW
jgi:predicted anti-sigma-YlaC factor YlaD